MPFSNSEKSTDQCLPNVQEWWNESTYNSIVDPGWGSDPQSTKICLDPSSGIFTDYALPENNPLRELRMDLSSDERDDDL